MKRPVTGVMVITLLAVGAGMLANLGGSQAASHAATGGEGTRAVGRSRAYATLPLRGARSAPYARHARTGPEVHVLRTATSLPHPRTTTVRRGAASQQTAVATVYRRGPAARHHGQRVLAATVQVVDPASVTLPPTGPVLLLNPNTAAPGGTINVLGSGFDARKLVTLTLLTGGTGATSKHQHAGIPFSLKGRNTFVLTGEQSHTGTTVTFTVQPYTPIAAPSSYGGGPGTTITFYGTGFAHHETVRVWLGQPGGTEVATMQTDGLGNLVARPGLIAIKPTTRPGKLAFTLTGDKSVTPATATFTVQAAGGPVVVGPSGAGGGQ